MDILLSFFIWSIITMQVRCKQGCRRGPFPYSPHLRQTMTMAGIIPWWEAEQEPATKSRISWEIVGSHWYWGYNGHLASRRIHIYIYILTYIYIYTYLHIYIHTYILTYIYIYTFIYLYVYRYINIFIFKSNYIYIHMYTCKYIPDNM